MISNLLVDIQQWAGIAWSINVMLGSTFIAASYLLMRRLLLKSESRRFSRYLGMLAFVCLVLLPMLSLFVSTNVVSTSASYSLFEMKTFAETNPLGDGLNWSLGVIAIYLVPSLLLLIRFTLGLGQLWWIRRGLSTSEHPQWQEILEASAARQGVSRTISLCESAVIDSPITFGWLRPVIVMPAGSRTWSSAMVEDVLTHELVHIRRLDWLSLIFVYAVASVFWMNPLVWIMYSRFTSDTEASCDEEVLLSGRDVSVYAQSLVSVARESGRCRPIGGQWLGQTMLERSQLELRVNYLMENDMTTIKTKNKGSVLKGLVALVIAVVLTGVLGSVNVVVAQSAKAPQKTSGSFIPITTVEPRYPTAAAEQGIEGWVHVRFTVNSLGSVQDIEVVEAEPADIFNESAMAAADQFKFTQPNFEGHPVAVPNVQYVFRYILSEDSEVTGPATR